MLNTKKIITTIGTSTCLITEEYKKDIAKDGLEWTFIIPPGTNVTADISDGGGTVTFLLSKIGLNCSQ